MHSFVASSAGRMMLIGVLATAIGLANSAPLSYSYERNELSPGSQPRVLVLLDQRIPELEDEMFSSSNDVDSTVVRTKRIGSLSIQNPVDVLRERVMLELARIKALQDQGQIGANQHLLETIGKRSTPQIRIALAKSRAADPGEMGERTQNWFDGDDPAYREARDEQSHRVQTNELRLL